MESYTSVDCFFFSFFFYKNILLLTFELQTDEIVRLNGIYKRLLSNAGVKMYEGEGKIVGPHEVEVTQLDGTKICYSAKHILIATGSRAVIPDIPGKVAVCSYFLSFSLSLSRCFFPFSLC